MLTTNNNIDFKTATANLKNELKIMDLNLSHGAALNLLSRTLGYADYNTYKAIGNKSAVDEKVRIIDDMDEIIKYGEQHDDMQFFRNILQLCGMNINELNISVQWMQNIPFTSKYKVFFREISHIWSDGDEQSLRSFDEFIVFTMPLMATYYLSPFLGRNDIPDMLFNMEDKELLKIAMQKNIFISPAICVALVTQEEKMQQAYDCALLYFEDEVSTYDISSPYLSTLIDIYGHLTSGAPVLNGYYDKGKPFTNREFVESLEDIEFQLKMKKSKKIISFKPVVLLNNFKNESWQIDFNMLFEEHFIKNPIMPII